MFIGHFALGVASKKIAPTLPIWILFLAPQFMDLLFIPLVALGIEGYEPGEYGHSKLDILYSHSLVGALLISGVAYWIGIRFWKTAKAGWILAGLSFSHWIIDLFVHHGDMPILPGNLGGFPMLGFGLWDFEYLVFGTEIVMALVAVVLYFHWALTAKLTKWWFIGPSIITLIFIMLAMGDIQDLPAF